MIVSLFMDGVSGTTRAHPYRHCTVWGCMAGFDDCIDDHGRCLPWKMSETKVPPFSEPTWH